MSPEKKTPGLPSSRACLDDEERHLTGALEIWKKSDTLQ